MVTHRYACFLLVYCDKYVIRNCKRLFNLLFSGGIYLMLKHENGSGSRVLLWIVYFSHAVDKVYFWLNGSKFVCNFLKSHSKHDMGIEREENWGGSVIMLSLLNIKGLCQFFLISTLRGCAIFLPLIIRNYLEKTFQD